MNVRKFFAKTSREALNMVRNELGDSAIILSNKEVDGGSQILASREEDMDTLINQAPTPASEVMLSSQRPKPNNAASNNKKLLPERPDSFLNMVRNQQRDESPSFASQFAHPDYAGYEDESESTFNQQQLNHSHRSHQQDTNHQREQNHQLSTTQNRYNADHYYEDEYASAPSSTQFQPSNQVQTKYPFGQDLSPKTQENSASQTSKMSQATTKNTIPKNSAKSHIEKAISNDANHQEMSSVMSEIRTMRSMLQSQIAEISWANTQRREPFKANLLNRMLTAGFSPSLSRQITEKLPKFSKFEQAAKWADVILCNNMRTIENEENLLDKGGVFAIIGPTGVGKTTTTAKLAARFVMKHGANKLGLITTDSYRIAGHEQLRIYGKILGVMVHTVKDQADMEIALNELRHKHTILIDTVGVSQRDRMVTEQIALLSSNNFHIKKLLCLNSTNTNETLTDVIRAYRGRGIDGCILTKLDEAATIGSALDVIIREKLRLYFVSNGQRVPEDLLAPNKQYLVHRAFKLGAANSQLFQHRPEDLAIIMANSISMEDQGMSSKIDAMEFNHA